MRFIASSSYLPNKIIDNKKIAQKLGITESFIEQRTGIKQRYFVEDETIEEMALKATQKLIQKSEIDVSQ